MITYTPLWETMRDKGISQYKMIKEFNFSAGQLSRLRKNAYVSTHTIETLCKILDCDVSDIMCYEKDSV